VKFDLQGIARLCRVQVGMETNINFLAIIRKATILPVRLALGGL